MRQGGIRVGVAVGVAVIVILSAMSGVTRAVPPPPTAVADALDGTTEAISVMRASYDSSMPIDYALDEWRSLAI